MSTETERTGRRLPWRVAALLALSVRLLGGYAWTLAAGSWASGGAVSGAEATAP
jgi:hypothetical protein